MPSYTTINTPIQQAVPGLPVYLLGTFDYTQADARFLITNAVLVGNVATITGSITAGNVPLSAGQLISVLCSNSIFNVNQAAITTSTIDATTGIGTISYPITHADVISAPATGRATILVAEVGETLANETSAVCSIQENVGPDNGRDITFEVTLSGGTPTATIAVQKAMNNRDTEFVDAGAGTNLNFAGASGTKSYTAVDINDRFVRFVVSGVSGGTSPKIVGKVLV